MKRIIPLLALLLGGCGTGIVPETVAEEQARSFCVGSFFGEDPDDIISDDFTASDATLFFDELFDQVMYQVVTLRLSGVPKSQAFTILWNESCNVACTTCWTMMIDFAYQIDLG